MGAGDGLRRLILRLPDGGRGCLMAGVVLTGGSLAEAKILAGLCQVSAAEEDLLVEAELEVVPTCALGGTKLVLRGQAVAFCSSLQRRSGFAFFSKRHSSFYLKQRNV